MAEKYCKCGHNRKTHQKNPNAKISFTGNCNECPCTEYMNRKLPNKMSIFNFIIGSITLGIFSALTILIINFVYSASFTTLWNEQAEDVTLGEWLTILSIALVLVNILLFELIYDPFLSYFKERKRHDYFKGETS